MHAHTPTHNLWLWPKRPPLAFSLAEMSTAQMSGPKRPRPKCPRPKCPTFVWPPVGKIIHSLKLVDYLQVQVDNPWYNYYIVFFFLKAFYRV